MVSVSFSLSARRPKDTRENIISTKEFTISIVTEGIVEAANSTSVESPADKDEWIISGLTRENSVGFPPLAIPFLWLIYFLFRLLWSLHSSGKAPLAWNARFVGNCLSTHMWSIYSLSYQLHSFQDISLSSSSEPTTTVVLGLIKKIHVRESILNKDGATIDLSKFRPVARLGGTTYARVLEGFDLPRISWKAVAEKYDEMADPKRR